MIHVLTKLQVGNLGWVAGVSFHTASHPQWRQPALLDSNNVLKEQKPQRTWLRTQQNSWKDHPAELSILHREAPTENQSHRSEFFQVASKLIPKASGMGSLDEGDGTVIWGGPPGRQAS